MSLLRFHFLSTLPIVLFTYLHVVMSTATGPRVPFIHSFHHKEVIPVNANLSINNLKFEFSSIKENLKLIFIISLACDCLPCYSRVITWRAHQKYDLLAAEPMK